MAVRAVLGVDVGTSSSRGVLVDFDGAVVRSAVREHSVGGIQRRIDHDRDRVESEP